MNRRKLLQYAGCLGAEALRQSSAWASLPASATASLPVIDTHIHLFDPSRAGGVPWPEKSDTVLYQPALPARYQAVVKGSGIVGAIAIEASPLKADNDWLLRTAEHNPVMVGAVGDLIPGASDYAADLERLHRNPLFLGIRYGNLWGRDLTVDLSKPGFMDGLKLLAQAGLVFESANPDVALIHTLAVLCEEMPQLTIVVDHLPHAEFPADAAGEKKFLDDLHRLRAASRVFVKFSEIPAVVNGSTSRSVDAYRPKLDLIWGIFGEERLMYGSDWPNSDHVLPFTETFALAGGYLRDKSPEARERLYWRNSQLAYRWRPRTREQTELRGS